MHEGAPQFQGLTECEFPETEKILLDITAKYQEGPQEKEVFETNAKKLQTIIDEIGWPTISRVGIEAASAAWLIAQHSDFDKNFQRRCLELMKAEASGEVPGAYIEQLESRLNS